MSWPWVVAFVLLWLTLLVVAVVLLGLLRRIVPVLERAEQRIGQGGPLDLGLSPGSTVGSFPVSRVDGEPATFPELLDTTSIALLLEASCEPCRHLLAGLPESDDATVEIPLKVLLEDTAEARELVDGVPVDVLYVRDRAAARAFQTSATPHAFTVEPGGLVLEKRVPSGVGDLRAMADVQRPAFASHAREHGEMGDRGFEPRTSALSERRSNRLS